MVSTVKNVIAPPHRVFNQVCIGLNVYKQVVGIKQLTTVGVVELKIYRDDVCDERAF